MKQPLALAAVLVALLGFASSVTAAPASFVPAPQLAQGEPGAYETFRHARHVAFRCQECHAMQAGHGTLVVATPTDCQSCHHAPPQLRDGCAACHQATELRNLVRPQGRRFSLSVLAVPVDRVVDFSHDVHEQRDCAECHTGPAPALTAAEVDCSSCHEEHHQADNAGCAACHEPAEADAHTLEVHQTCAGSGCHLDPPFRSPPRSRTGCLWCHEEQVDHEPSQACTDCHFVSTAGRPRGGALGPRSGDHAWFSPSDAVGARRLPVDFRRRYLHAVHRPRS